MFNRKPIGSVIIMVAVCASSVFAQQAVGNDWIEWPVSEGGNGHYYRLTAAGTWDAAEKEAVALGGHLVTVNNTDEDAWLHGTFNAQMSSVGAWIGFYQDTGDAGYVEPVGGWKWISGEPVTYTGWFGAEPNNQGGGEDWAVLELTAACCEWNDIGPSSGGFPIDGVPGIVERELPPIPTMSEYGLLVLLLLALTVGTIVFQRSTVSCAPKSSTDGYVGGCSVGLGARSLTGCVVGGGTSGFRLAPPLLEMH